MVRLGVAALGLGMDCKADDICDPAIIGTSTYTKALLERYITPSRAGLTHAVAPSLCHLCQQV